MNTPPSIADRAARAVANAERTPNLRQSRRPHRRREYARLTRVVSATFGVDPADIVVGDDPERVYGEEPGYLISVRNGRDTVYRFVPDIGDTETLHLLTPCPHCDRTIPSSPITSLADLGHVLAGSSPTSNHVCQQP